MSRQSRPVPIEPAEKCAPGMFLGKEQAMRKRLALSAILPWMAGLVLALPVSIAAGSARGRTGAGGPLPRLVVLIVVDQMRADYPERFASFFGEKGFRRLAREGRVFTQARLAHAVTLTGPGHSVIGSGLYADRSGIVGNRWYSHETGQDEDCALGPAREGEPGECAPEGEGTGKSPPVKRTKNPCAFGGKTLAERVKERYPGARVVGVSLKYRPAILMVGKKADAAYWVEVNGDGSAALACSGYYPSCHPKVMAYGDEEGLTERPSAPGSMTLFRRHPAWREWSCSLPSPCEKACPGDVVEAHSEEAGLGKSFPHPVKDPDSLLDTPFGDDLLEGLAERVVEMHGLGKNPRGVPDVLAVSFSGTDNFGHLFGPDSCEAADGMKRLDGTLGRFLDFLAERIGKEGLLVFVTGDHGTAPLPEVSLRKGIPAGRIDLHASVDRRSGKIGDLPPLRQRLELALAGRLGSPLDADTPLSKAFISAFHGPDLYLNREKIGEKRLPLCRSWLKEHLLSLEGIQEVYTAEEIETGNAPEAVRLAYRADRAGDLLVFTRPYWTMSGPGGGADHGQLQDYDTRVPLLAWGGGVTSGVEERAVDVAQIAPTLAALLDLDASGFSRPSPLPLGRSK